MPEMTFCAASAVSQCSICAASKPSACQRDLQSVCAESGALEVEGEEPQAAPLDGLRVLRADRARGRRRAG